MSRTRAARFGLVSLIAVLAFGVLAFASPAAATSTSVTIHARICPATGVTDLFTDCHPHAVTNAKFRFDGRRSQSVNAHGNTTFTNVAAGTYTVSLSSGDQPNEFLRLRAYCSDSNTGSAAVERTVHTGRLANFSVNVQTGQAIVCDVYWIPQ